MAAEERNGEVFTDEECTDCTERERSFDALARGLANGSISRRKALRMLGAALVGSALASIPGMALAKPPPGACKPQGAKCIVNRDCCSQNCFTQKGKMICGPVSGACFNNNDCTSFPGQDQCTKAVCNQATGACVLEPICTGQTTCLSGTCCNNALVCGNSCLAAACAASECLECDEASGTCRTKCGTNQTCIGGDCCDNTRVCGNTCLATACDATKCERCDAVNERCVSTCTAPKTACNSGVCVCPQVTCSGGRVQNPTTCQCECPGGQVVCPGNNTCVPACTGGRILNASCQCVCPVTHPNVCTNRGNRCCTNCGSGGTCIAV